MRAKKERKSLTGIITTLLLVFTILFTSVLTGCATRKAGGETRNSEIAGSRNEGNKTSEDDYNEPSISKNDNDTGISKNGNDIAISNNDNDTGISKNGNDIAISNNDNDTGISKNDNGTGILKNGYGPAEGGMLRVFSTPPDTLNPLKTTNIYIRQVLGLMYRKLFEVDKNGIAQPVLVENWSVAEDGITWDFTLKKNIKWHDGKELDSSDVVFTLNKLLNPALGLAYDNPRQIISSVVAVDKYSFRLVLKRKYAFIEYVLCIPLVSSSYGDSYGEVNIGNGYYRFSRYNSQKKILTLDSNGKTYLKGIEVRFMNNIKAGLEYLQANKLDIMLIKGNNRISGGVYSNKRNLESGETEIMAFNCRKGLLSRSELRKAIHLILHENENFNKIVSSNGMASFLPVFPGHTADMGLELTRNGDNTNVNKLLSDAGYIFTKGRYVKKSGNGNSQSQISLNILVNRENSARVNIAGEVASILRKEGINANLVVVSYDELINRATDYNYDIILTGVGSSTLPDFSNAYGAAGASPFASSLFNMSGIYDQGIIQYFHSINSETDSVRRKAQITNLILSVNREMPYMAVFNKVNVLFVNKRINNTNEFSKENIFKGIENWYINDGS